MENIFCLKHIIGLIWTFILIVILIIITKKIEKKYDIKKILKFSSLILIILEIIKYIYLGKNFGLNDLPIQFCSLVLYTYPLIAFGSERIKNFVLPFSFIAGLLAGLVALILPTNILGDPNIGWLNSNNILYTLSFIYHAYMIYFSLYLVISKCYKPKYKDIISTSILTTFFVIIAVVMNNILGMDYMMLNKGIGNPLNFLISYGRHIYILVQFILFIALDILTIFIVKILQKN